MMMYSMESAVAALGAEYEILSELGRGGVSVVFLARDRELGRQVAIKVVRDGSSADEDTRARFEREARLLARLQHPNIVLVYSAKRLPDGGLALIMSHTPGRTLRELLRERGALPLVLVESILRDLASGLNYLHGQGIVHRDLKPENIFIDETSGRALISDFGIAKSLQSQSNVTLSGVVIGTPAYMSPEQIDGGELDSRSDLYSLGLIGHEMLTGARPWDGETIYSVIYKQKNEELPSLMSLRPDTPVYLQVAIAGAVAKDPSARWADAAAFLAHLSPLARRDAALEAPIELLHDDVESDDAAALTVQYRLPGAPLQKPPVAADRAGAPDVAPAVAPPPALRLADREPLPTPSLTFFDAEEEAAPVQAEVTAESAAEQPNEPLDVLAVVDEVRFDYRPPRRRRWSRPSVLAASIAAVLIGGGAAFAAIELGPSNGNGPPDEVQSFAASYGMATGQPTLAPEAEIARPLPPLDSTTLAPEETDSEAPAPLETAPAQATVASEPARLPPPPAEVNAPDAEIDAAINSFDVSAPVSSRLLQPPRRMLGEEVLASETVTAPVLRNAGEIAELLRPHYQWRGRMPGPLTLIVTVDGTGRVTEASIASSSGDGGLDRAALQIASSLRFEPGRAGGRPITMRARVPIRLVPPEA
ncbi:MAG: TonB family protein [Longimicrobiales bacterium]